eukprot:GHVN01011768.1.p1 GENE.GHVN01011768.1~~GHVN01011768.1.p1  ORF type:complete len:126 (-),score=16.62 GHVN01011768.1:213-590(-)
MYFIGELLRHIPSQNRVVVIGWDAKGSAPPPWFDHISSGSKKRQRTLETTFYLIMTKSHASLIQAHRGQIAYVAEEELDLQEETDDSFDPSVFLGHIFVSHDVTSSRFLPPQSSHLRKSYPDDWK